MGEMPTDDQMQVIFDWFIHHLDTDPHLFGICVPDNLLHYVMFSLIIDGQITPAVYGVRMSIHNISLFEIADQGDRTIGNIGRCPVSDIVPRLYSYINSLFPTTKCGKSYKN